MANTTPTMTKAQFEAKIRAIALTLDAGEIPWNIAYGLQLAVLAECFADTSCDTPVPLQPSTMPITMDYGNIEPRLSPADAEKMRERPQINRLTFDRDQLRKVVALQNELISVLTGSIGICADLLPAGVLARVKAAKEAFETGYTAIK